MYDLVIQKGYILDGSGKEGYFADVAIRGGKIAAIGNGLGTAKEILDATGLVVTPGFIDSHSHADKKVLQYPVQSEKTEQGITTSVAGQCGGSAAPVDGMSMPEFLEKLENTPLGSNMVAFVGHGNLRRAVMGDPDRIPTKTELDTMKALLAQALEKGAGGLSFGLYYAPGCFAGMEEMVELAKVAARYGRPISAHIRNESDLLEESVEEFLEVVRKAGVRGILSHHKAARVRNWHKIEKTLKLLQDAVAEGLDVYCDVYPYCASSTTFSELFIPKSWRTEGLSGLLKRIADPVLCRENKEAFLKREGEDLSWVLVTKCPGYPQYEGLRLPQIAAHWGKDCFNTAMELIRETRDQCVSCFFSIGEPQMLRVLSWERAMVGTDGGLAGTLKVYHPRVRGTFPRALRYARETGIVSLPEMIRKMTALPAYVYGLKNKGLLKTGYDADLCVFDPETVTDRAEFTDCSARAEGLRWVLVNGQIVSENAAATGAAPGKLLKRYG